MISILIDEQRYYNLLEKNKELNIKTDELKDEIIFLKQENREYEEVLGEWDSVRKEIIAACEIRKRLGRRPGKLEMILQKIEGI